MSNLLNKISDKLQGNNSNEEGENTGQEYRETGHQAHEGRRVTRDQGTVHGARDDTGFTATAGSNKYANSGQQMGGRQMGSGPMHTTSQVGTTGINGGNGNNEIRDGIQDQTTNYNPHTQTRLEHGAARGNTNDTSYMTSQPQGMGDDINSQRQATNLNQTSRQQDRW